VVAWDAQSGHWEKLLTRRVVQHWNRLTGEVKNSRTLRGFKTQLDNANGQSELVLATVMLLMGDRTRGTQKSIPAGTSTTVRTLKLNKHALLLT